MNGTIYFSGCRYHKARLNRVRRVQSFWNRSWSLIFWWIVLATVLFALHNGHVLSDDKAHAELLSPLPSQKPLPAVSVAPKPATPSAEAKPVDLYVGQAVDEFVTDPARQSEVRMIIHCLLYRESKHGLSTSKGDGGLAAGPLQFHEATWIEYRRIMIARGLATEIGSLFDLKEAIRTAVWAIMDGRATAWGPILRASEGSTFVTCPVPSWYR